MQANACGMGSVTELTNYSTIKLGVMLKMREVQEEWNRDNNG